MTKTAGDMAIDETEFDKRLFAMQQPNLILRCDKLHEQSAKNLLCTKYKIGRNNAVIQFNIALDVNDSFCGWELVAA